MNASELDRVDATNTRLGFVPEGFKPFQVIQREERAGKKMAKADISGEINTLMKTAQKEGAAAQSEIDTSVTTKHQADVALDTLKTHFSIHHGKPPSHLDRYIKDDFYISELFGATTAVIITVEHTAAC